MDSRNRRQAASLAQRQAAQRLGQRTLPDPLRLEFAAHLLVEGADRAARAWDRHRWYELLENAAADGEFPTVTLSVPTGVSRAGVQEHTDELAVALADLRTWLVAIGAPVPEWLPGIPEKASMPRARDRTRVDRLNVAIKAALDVLTPRLKRPPTVPELFAYLREHDEHGIIEDSNTQYLFWTTTEGTQSKTALTSLYKRVARLTKP